MSLTVGTGPFGHRPTGRFDFELPDTVTFVEVHPRRVRATKDGETVIDSERVRLVYRTASLPRFAFPSEDVRVPSEPEPAVEGYVSVAWDAVDAWLEEDDEVELEVDGAVVTGPRTQWSGTEWLARYRSSTGPAGPPRGGTTDR